MPDQVHARERMVERQLARRGITDDHVLGAVRAVPREVFVPEGLREFAYDDAPLPIEAGQTISQPYIVGLMIQAARESRRILESPAPSVWLRAFGESSVDHEILAWVGDPELGIGSVQSEVLNRLWVLFKEHNVALPYPQRDIYIKEWPGPPPTDG